MRTEGLTHLRKRLSTLNNGYCQSLFLAEQFSIDHGPRLADRVGQFTGKAFETNRYAKSFNFDCSQVATRITEFNQIAFASFFVFMYSAFELYLEELVPLVETITANTSAIIQAHGTSTTEWRINVLFDLLGSSSHKCMRREESETIEYLKLRRNSLIHADGEVSRKLRKLNESSGERLSKYWQAEIPKLNTIDFSAQTPRQFKDREVVDVHRVIVELAVRIDDRTLCLIGINKLIEFILQELRRTHADDLTQRSRRRCEQIFCLIANRMFGLNRDEFNVEALNLGRA